MDQIESLINDLSNRLATVDADVSTLVEPVAFLLAGIMAQTTDDKLDREHFRDTMILLYGLYAYHCNTESTEVPDNITIQ